MFKKVVLFFTLVGIVLWGGALRSAYAQSGIIITPTTMTIAGGDRFTFATLVNNGNIVQTYEMKLLNMRMTEPDGNYSLQDGPVYGVDIADHLAFSPKRVTLAPGAKQKVRIALRRPDGIPDGDYIVHMLFNGIPPQADTSVQEGTGEGKRVTPAVSINVSYTIPLIVRVGEANESAKIDDGYKLTREAVDNNHLKLTVPVSKVKSNYALIGHMYVYHVSDSGQEDLVGEVGNANLFPEIEHRNFEVVLNKDLSGGALKIVLVDNFKKGTSENAKVYAEKVIPMQ